MFSLSTFATNLLVLLAIAATTDYAIFMLGRYHEARNAGEDRETAFYTMFPWDCPRDLGLRIDHCRRHVLP
ncbi:MMPL family protein [Mycobacterium kansasii]|uniref:MMPL family protein n=1 Tax=Mycobacterium kansasii TaxID=1768 RepID=A0A1V3W9J5_MYCKA|nr:MMPL family protein [Mycobacterium kansasii]